MLATLLLFFSSSALADSGFVLTQWGHWTQAEAVTALNQAQSVGSKHLSILMHLCQPKKTDSAISWCDSFEYQRDRLLALVPEIQARGMSFSLIPFPAAADEPMRQWIWPNDRPAWFRSYGDRAVELAELGKHAGASELVVGSELTLLFTAEHGWREVIRRVRAVFPGHLTLSPVFAQYPFIGFWDALDSVGVSAYFPLAMDDRLSTQTALENAWQVHRRHLRNFARSQHKPLTFVEVGYPTTEVAASKPWDYSWNQRKLDLELPARCWEAFRKVWAGEPVLRSFRIWGLTGQATEPRKGFSPIGKPAEDPVRRLFLERSLP